MTFQINIEKDKGEWLLNILPHLSPSEEKLLSFAKLKSNFETDFESFELFWFSKPIEKLKEFGLFGV